MMPFSVLRPWFLGSLSWVLLGLGVYCGWLALQEYRRDTRPVVDLSPQIEPVDADGRRPDGVRQVEVISPSRHPPRADHSRFWTYLVTSVALLGLNFGGKLPLRWLLANRDGPTSASVTPTKELWIDRPDGSRLHVQVYGVERGPTLVLTHGWSLDVTSWDYALAELSQRCRVVTWDLAGLGRSQSPKNHDFSLEKMADDLHAVLQKTCPQGNVVLVGHSIGGMITQVYSRRHREQIGAQVQGLALVHTTYVNPLRTCFAAGLASALEWPLITPFNYLTIVLAPWVWLSNWQSYLNGSLHLTTRISSFSGKQTWRQLDHAALLAVKAWPGVFARGNLAMQRFDAESNLAEIDVPVLVLAGEHDRMTLPSASEHMERKLIAARPFQIPTGHLGMWECPHEFVLAMIKFVDQVASTDRVEKKRAQAAQGG